MNTRLVVVKDGEELPGFCIRAGDHVVQTHYDHGEKLMTVYVGPEAKWWRVIWERMTRRAHV